MKRLSLTICLVLLFTGSQFSAKAHDLSVSLSEGGRLFFNITDTLKRTVEVTYEGGVSSKHENQPKGELNIPSMIEVGTKCYFVTSIGPKAFSGATELESVSMPENLTSIGAFAFEDCTALQSVEFPKKQAKIGEGAFFGCQSLNCLLVGSQWKMLDLSHFRWSVSLKQVEVPASVVELKNLKTLKCLENISVREQNKVFASCDGLLYSKDMKKLYACPVAHKGVVVVKDGVEEILNDAFKSCTGVTQVTLPATLQKLSFAEFRSLSSLEILIFLSETPLNTAVCEGKEIFCLMLAKPERVSILVPKASFKAYSDAIVSKDGRFESLEGKSVGIYGKDVFAAKKNIKKSK